MSEIKITKKDLQEAKAPDAVLTQATSVFDWIVDHRNVVLGTVVVVLALAIGFSASQAQSKKALAERGAKLSTAVELGSRIVVEGDKPSEDPENKTFHSYDAKRAAIIDALKKVVADHPGTETARTAGLRLAVAELDAGNADAAIKGIEEYLAGGDVGLTLLAHESLGFAYEKKADFAKAGDAFAKLTADGAPARALFHKGRLAELQGKKDEARAAYQQVIKEFEKELIAGDAKGRLELLDLAPLSEAGFTAAPPPAPEPEKPTKKGKAKAKKGKGT